jgi:hypothetical protein
MSAAEDEFILYASMAFHPHPIIIPEEWKKKNAKNNGADSKKVAAAQRPKLMQKALNIVKNIFQ